MKRRATRPTGVFRPHASAHGCLRSAWELGAEPVISSFGENGVLLCTNLAPGTMAVVEWAPSATGPWTNNWAGLDSVRVDSNGVIQVSVPMFYRVRGTNSEAVTNSGPLGMVLIPAGSFMMGNSVAPGEGDTDEVPVHTVNVSAFYLDTNLVSKAQWDQVYQWAIGKGYSFDNAGSGKAANHPVQTINWYDCVKWCNARSEKEGLVPAYYLTPAQTNVYRTGRVDLGSSSVNWSGGYRLPTEPEWEKAARGGTLDHRFPWADADTISPSRANYYADTNSFAYDVSSTPGYSLAYATGEFPYTSPIGSFAPNAYGLYDMAGNVFEWCWDWYEEFWYANGLAAQDNTRGPAGPLSLRVLRGGDWNYTAFFSRCSYQYDNGVVGPSYSVTMALVFGVRGGFR